MNGTFKILAVSALLVGCAVQEAPKPPQIVNIAVPEPCLSEQIPKPVYETETIADNATDGQKILALLGDWIKSRAYEGQLEAALEGCM